MAKKKAKKKSYDDRVELTFNVTLTYKGKERKDRNDFEYWFKTRHANWMVDGEYEVSLEEARPHKIEKDPKPVYKRTNTNSTLRDLIIDACKEAGYTKSSYKKIQAADESSNLCHVVGDYAWAQYNGGFVTFNVISHWGVKYINSYSQDMDYISQAIEINPETGEVKGTYYYYINRRSYWDRERKAIELKGNVADPDIKKKIANFIGKTMKHAYNERKKQRSN